MVRNGFGRISEAKAKLEEILLKWPNDGVALVHYGFVLKQEGELSRAVDFFERGINTSEPGTQDGRFYFHMGDALQRLKRDTDAMKVCFIAFGGFSPNALSIL